MNKAKPLTEEELNVLPDFPKAHKDAIERSIGNWILPDDSEDKTWPNYFRGEVVECMRGCQISEDDQLKDCEYDTECVWFQGGWKARERTSQEKLV